MCKLDKAVRAAAVEIYDKDPMRQDVLEAAIQAAIEVLTPPPIKSGEIAEKGLSIFSPEYEDGYNACRSQILENAEITDFTPLEWLGSPEDGQ